LEEYEIILEEYEIILEESLRRTPRRIQFGVLGEFYKISESMTWTTVELTPVVFNDVK
jgi:hypothetical protein